MALVLEHVAARVQYPEGAADGSSVYLVRMLIYLVERLLLGRLCRVPWPKVLGTIVLSLCSPKLRSIISLKKRVRHATGPGSRIVFGLEHVHERWFGRRWTLMSFI